MIISEIKNNSKIIAFLLYYIWYFKINVLFLVYERETNKLVINTKKMKTSTLKLETLNHLTIVAEQINKTGAFDHFTKMVNANVNPISLQEILISKYNVNPTSLDYLYKGSDEQCVESSLLIAIRCDELRSGI